MTATPPRYRPARLPFPRDPSDQHIRMWPTARFYRALGYPIPDSVPDDAVVTLEVVT